MDISKNILLACIAHSVCAFTTAAGNLCSNTEFSKQLENVKSCRNRGSIVCKTLVNIFPARKRDIGIWRTSHYEHPNEQPV